MILYTLPDCPLCTVTKVKLNAKNIPFDVCMDETEMDKLGIDRLPVLKTDNEELLEFSEIMARLKEGTL
jgi:glutaredoxin